LDKQEKQKKKANSFSLLNYPGERATSSNRKNQHTIKETHLENEGMGEQLTIYGVCCEKQKQKSIVLFSVRGTCDVAQQRS